MGRDFEPLGDGVVIRPIEREEVTSSGIVLPDTAKEKPQEGEVMAVGPGRAAEDGKRVAMEVKTGDTVLYRKYSGTEVKDGDEEFLIVRESDIVARIK
jgi:chaperonin GroES